MTSAGMSHRFGHRIQVRFRDCDPMDHVNNAVYFTYMEQARFEYARSLLGSPAAEAFGIILAHAACDFRAPAKYGDSLDVRVRLVEIGRASFTLEYEIVDVDTAVVVATGRSVQVSYDYGLLQSIPIPQTVRDRLERELVK